MTAPGAAKNRTADVSPVLFSPGCGLTWVIDCAADLPGRCGHERRCPADTTCCPTVNCPAVGVCRGAGSREALSARSLYAAPLCLSGAACHELGACPADAACHPACQPTEACLLHRDEPAPRCFQAAHLCRLYGACDGTPCPQPTAAVAVSMQCPEAGVVCNVVDGPPVCRRNDCRGGLACYVSALLGRECIDFAPCSRTSCPAGLTCREQQPFCLRAPCPPVAVCSPGGQQEPMFPCRRMTCPSGLRCTLAAGAAGQPAALCVPEAEPCVPAEA
ncbi:DBF4-type zinc finger-containing protein 2 homolog [Pollicipes pollicipes]|uniref:DBF4-type zinc finger-containing protein 2 homolog n=1 Tax=Pollicipes pollicipes TaxID=41117 RepID=UPI0018852220|nr:DBF4-type zinc finger-containing protein 2 homolog [Pollicipes pollicipes]